MLKLAERMVISYCTGVGASTAHAWTTLSATGCDDVRVMTRKSTDEPGRPPGIVLSAATSFWLPVPPKRVFDFLRDENSRNEVCIIFKYLQWDTRYIYNYIYSSLKLIHSIGYIHSGTFSRTGV